MPAAIATGRLLNTVEGAYAMALSSVPVVRP